MDKFAVDLDQVLNDFEYSELTDQYNATRSASASAPTQNSAAMHSINNVFHSLNEYLNTNIDVTVHSQKHITPAKDNVDVSKPSEEFVDDPGINITETHNFNEIDVPNTEDPNVVDQAEASMNTIEEVLDTGLEYHGNCRNKDDIEDLVIISDDLDAFHAFDSSVDEKEPIKIEFDPQEIDIATPDNTDKNETVENNDTLKNEKMIENPEVIENIHAVVEDSMVKSEENDINKATTHNSEDTSTTIGFVDELNLDDTTINQLLAELEEEFKDEADSDEKSEAQFLDEDQVDTVLADKESCSSYSVSIQDVIGEEITSTANASVDSESSETVKNNHLFDDEIKEKTSLIYPLPTTEMGDGNIDEDNKIEVTTKEENTKTDVTTNFDGSETDVTINDEDTNTDVGANFEDTNFDVTKNCHDTQNDGRTIDKDTNSDLATIKEDTKTDMTKMTPLEPSNPGVGDCSDAKTIIGIDNNISEHQEMEDAGDSTSRPQNLSLKESDDDSHREINLIGNPGSTPYNNVYVREEIHKHGHGISRDSDGSSSSDSFSDADSTASTASTEEVKDEHDSSVDGEFQSAATVENPKGNTADDDAGSSDKDQQSGNGGVENNSEPGNDRVENTDTRAESEEAPEEPESESVTLTCSNASADFLLENIENEWLGKRAPHWIPDADTTSCLHCDMKFTVLKRRHHCRACGLVLCSKCCHLRFKLDYLDAEARVCNKCHDILNRDSNSSSGSERTPDEGNSPLNRPNPNNPLEYCSTVSPLEQAVGGNASPPAVMVPVGVLKRKGSNKGKSNKSVMFCDGIRPGSDLTNLDNDFNYNNTKTKKLEKTNTSAGKINRNLPIIDSETNTFIPKNENSLPPIVTISKTDITYTDCPNNPTTIEMLKNDVVTFALQLSLYVHVKIIDMGCCINKMAWCFSTEGLINVGQDEIVYLLEYMDEESFVPKDLFYHINNIYVDAVKGTSIKELGLSLHNTTNFLDSKNHAGFVYIVPSFQCLENVIKPNDPFLIGILIHRWETPWAKLFPLRLILRLGAEYRYYPSPIISSRHRDSVFVEVGHTIINLLADFRNYSYSLPQIRGLTIHMEDKNTTVTIPMNRYDQVVKSLNNTSDHILAFAGSFSQLADSHLVCIQDTQGNDNSYSTHAINIHNKPRKITGASFIVFNGALKSSSGLTAKSNIVEDGLMIQVLPEHMQQIRDKLRAMKNHTISCGCVDADSDETVNIVWGENDANFNIGVNSTIDNMSLSGIPSIRVHNGKNHVCANGNRIIRWTEVFIIQSGEENAKNQDPVDISRLSENIAKATCDALVNYLDLLLTNSFQKIGIRTTLQTDNVSYCAGSNGVKLPPIYMKSLDNELIPVLHRLTSSNLGESTIVIELIFRILNV